MTWPGGVRGGGDRLACECDVCLFCGKNLFLRLQYVIYTVRLLVFFFFNLRL